MDGRMDGREIRLIGRCARFSLSWLLFSIGSSPRTRDTIVVINFER